MTEGGNAIETIQPLILIADDDEDILELVRLRLARCGYATVLARDGAEAVAAARERKPDLALLDVAMPALDGYEVTAILKGEPATKDIPIVLLTARAQTGDVAKGLEAGADDYITKPFSPQELLLRVSSALKSAPRPLTQTLLGALRPASGQ
jgi:DNA-binding response OmpR family regulator